MKLIFNSEINKELEMTSGISTELPMTSKIVDTILELDTKVHVVFSFSSKIDLEE